MKHIDNKNYCISLLLIALILQTSIPLYAYKAVITVPVADLVGSPVSTHNFYQELPLCGATHQPLLACQRLHQALFNQVVDVTQEREDQVCIAVPNVFYVTPPHETTHNTFWTLKCTLTPVTTLEERGINLAHIPAPLNAASKKVPQKHIITLIEPVHDTVTGLTFSAGTRFVQNPTSDKQIISVYRYNPATHTMETMRIPTKKCLMGNPHLSPQEQVKQYVALARHWVHASSNAIPYVWGGCSYIDRSISNNFTEVIKNKEYPTSHYVRPDCMNSPKSGLDCSGLICLATQCCGIPYFLKNSTTVAHCLKPVTASENIIEGDIIWIPKHVMLVSDLKKNRLIEARHYGQGYGIVHEVPLSAVFKGIHTYHDLHQACVQKKPLIRLDSDGKNRETIYECKILQIMSVYPG